MQDPICPFSATLARDTFGCVQAERIIRRGGTEFACRAPAAHDRCRQLFGQFKDAALTAFDVEDDLTQIPHGVLVKIQFGGLLGLRRLLTGQPSGDGRIEDIDTLVREAVTSYGDPQTIPCEQVTEDMTGYTLARRSRR